MCLIGGCLSSEVGEDRSSNLLSRTFFLFWCFITDSCNNTAFLRYMSQFCFPMEHFLKARGELIPFFLCKLVAPS